MVGRKQKRMNSNRIMTQQGQCISFYSERFRNQRADRIPVNHKPYGFSDGTTGQELIRKVTEKHLTARAVPWNKNAF
jgi:hypothetical protein